MYIIGTYSTVRIVEMSYEYLMLCFSVSGAPWANQGSVLGDGHSRAAAVHSGIWTVQVGSVLGDGRSRAAAVHCSIWTVQAGSVLGDGRSRAAAVHCSFWTVQIGSVLGDDQFRISFSEGVHSFYLGARSEFLFLSRITVSILHGTTWDSFSEPDESFDPGAKQFWSGFSTLIF